MFEFDPEVFRNGNSKISESLTDLDSLQGTVGEAIGLSADIDDIDLSDLNTSINDIKAKLTLLQMYSNKTLSLYEEIESASSSSGDVDYSAVLLPNSPFSIGIDGEYGSNQGSAYFLFEEYVRYKSIKRMMDNQGDSDPGSPGSSGAPGFPGQFEALPPNMGPGFAVDDDFNQSQIDSIIKLFNEQGITNEGEMLFILDTGRKQGCGHAVMTNWVCEKYSSNPEEFEAKYGYPLFVEKDGHMTYNYETIFTDIFMNSNEELLSKVKNHDDNFTLSEIDASVHPDEMKDRYSSFLGEETDTVVTTRDISVETYKEMVAKGYTKVCIAAYRYEMKPHGCNEETENYIANKETENGHWMTITGISENGNLIVSSYGQEWELLSSDIYAKFPVDGVQAEDRDDACMVFSK